MTMKTANPRPEAYEKTKRAEPQPLPDNFRSVQPGGGRCHSIELAWGRWRRWWLTRFRPGYVRKMAARRRGEASGAPHEILDPRDLKYWRPFAKCHWDAKDDPFRWRDRLPFTRWGFAELLLMAGPLLAITILVGWLFPYAAIVPGVLFLFVCSFFRDPPRRVPTESNILVSPADGKVVEITKLPHDEFIDGPAVRIAIFLSIFNVHLNRAPAESRVIAMRYSPGAFLDARNPECAIRNENTWIALEEEASPHRRMTIRQISGAIARRIVCDVKPGEVLARGQKFGMIKFGSRTELVVADTEDLKIEVAVGEKIKAGTTVVARFGSKEK